MNTHKVMVIGLDGATLDLIRPWAEAGHLPNLKRLIDTGTTTVLESTIPPMSPSAWTSFMTGKNPGKHGIFDFTQRDYRNYRTLITSRTHEATLWGILSHYGRRVCVMNVPQTYPPERVNGVMVTGLGTPAHHQFTYPAEEGARLAAQGYQVNAEVAYQQGQEDAFLDSAFHASEVQVEAAERYLQQEAWDFFMLVIRHTDEVPHFFWKYMDPEHPAYEPAPERWQQAILEGYQRSDAAIGRLLEAAGPDVNVILLSDHGFGPLYRDVYLNRWLEQQGFLYRRQHTSVAGRLETVLRRVGFTRSSVGPWLSRIGLGRLRAWLRTTLGSRANLIPNDDRPHVSELVDWSRTKAYSMGYIGQMYINLKGRDPQGIVEPGAEYEQVCQELAEALRAWRHPGDQKPIVDTVIRKHEILHGDHVSHAPDLFVLMRNLTYITRESYEWPTGDELFAVPPTGENAAHRIEGVLMAAGPAFKSVPMNAVQIVDLAPTILHILGHPIPEDMDGRVLVEMLTSSGKEEIKTTQSITGLDTDHYGLSAEEEALVAERLRTLGYLD